MPSTCQKVSWKRESLGPRKHPHILYVLAVGAFCSTVHQPKGRDFLFGVLQLSPVPASELHLGTEGALVSLC